MSRPRIRPLSTNTVTGTGTFNLSVGHMFGGFDLNTDGVNVGTIVIRDLNVSGTILAVSKSIAGKNLIAPIEAPSGVIYYSVAGSGADAFLYEWDYQRSTKY